MKNDVFSFWSLVYDLSLLRRRMLNCDRHSYFGQRRWFELYRQYQLLSNLFTDYYLAGEL